ncbi:MAG: hypothetical protein V4850_08415 [Myxococcota bacterium]
MVWLALLGLFAGTTAAEPAPQPLPEPSGETVVYYNARMALREGHALEAVELWFLRNALENQSGRVSPHDADFRSVTWAALGELGLCQDGYAKDVDGAGLWPLALHNQVLRNLGRGKPPRPQRPFLAFEVDRQQRFVSITDVLGSKELDTLKLSRSRCTRPWLAKLAAGESVIAKLSDRQVATRLLRHLLTTARTTLAEGRVRGLAVLDARLFDIDLQLTALAAREARDDARKATRRGRELGLSRASATAMLAEAPTTTLDPDSAAAAVLRACVAWPTSEWMALSPDRRLYLFTRARTDGASPEASAEAFEKLGLGIVDALIAAGEGGAAEAWIGAVAASDDPARRRVAWDGARGQALLALDSDAGFRERGVIALHRGVDQLARGELMDALRSLAFARQHADESRTGGDLAGLSLRWLSYVAGQFALSSELLVTLQELVPRQDYAVILEDLLWSAAFHADRRSFEDGLANQVGRGALERRLALLAPLAAGDLRRFSAGIRAGLTESPGETLRFLDLFVQRLELEDAGVRAAQLPTLVAIRQLLAPLETGEGGRQGRTAALLMERTLAIAGGVGGLPESSERDRARSLAPTGEVFAGSIRLAPADPLPWPFRAPEPSAPSVFVPIELRPLEWRDAAGELVFGWSIRG